MSKTDKTRPWWVKATERPMVTCVPVHRHENGQCDLPDNPHDRTHFGAGRDRDSCYWDASAALTYSGDGYCGCRMCTMQAERRAERRRERRAGRRLTRAAAIAYHTGDIDEH